MSMSNPSVGTRNLSAGDWTRLKRLTGARTFMTDTPDSTPSQTIYNPSIHVYRTAGVSKISRPASFWIDYSASQVADYVIPYVFQATSPPVVGDLAVIKICDCSTNPLETKTGVCVKCLRM